MKAVSDIGLIGLAVMGENLVLNMESKGFHVSVYNRTVEKVDKFMEGRGKGKNIYGAHSLEDFVASLKTPRKVFLMVKAGQAVDAFIDQLIPVLEPGDIIIDGGNTHFPDTTRRTEYVESKGLLYIGTGVSGGEEGALKGPSMMPGGSPAAWPHVKPIFQSVCAKVADGSPCCDWVGEGGAGHFVKMVHNGIEYGDIQLICECYQIMRDILGMTNEEMHEVFAEWNRGDLDSYLIEITRDILAKKDEDGNYLMGIQSSGKYTKANLLTALEYGAYEVKFLIVSTLESLKMLVTGKAGVGQLSGPVGIVSEMDNIYQESKAYGFLNVLLQFLYFGVLLSANLGVMNLLPLPALDGGRLVFLTIEAIRGKRVAPDKEGWVHAIGLILLLGLMAFVMFNDIRKLF